MKRILLCYTALLVSCTSTDDSQTRDPQDSNFYALTVGNAWVYKNYKYNYATELYDETGVIDSVSIIGTEDIFGVTYFKFRRWTVGNEPPINFCNPNGEHFEYLREFEGNLVDSSGKLKFTNNDFSERIMFDNSWGTIYEKLVEGTNELIVEAGSFSCINSERYVITSEGVLAPAKDRFYYADGYGLIYDTSSYVSQDSPFIIRRLDSYIIN